VEDVSYFAALVAGILSFVSPCVLPLVPGYLSFISGVSLDNAHTGTALPEGTTRRVFLASIAFVLGFTCVFVALGASASSIGALINEKLWILTKIAGVAVILFGLHTMGLLKINALYRQAQIDVKRKPAGPLGAFVVGLAFAFGWTPCIGPILGSILALAAQEGTVRHGASLLAVYSFGLGVPFGRQVEIRQSQTGLDGVRADLQGLLEVRFRFGAIPLRQLQRTQIGQDTPILGIRLEGVLHVLDGTRQVLQARGCIRADDEGVDILRVFRQRLVGA